MTCSYQASHPRRYVGPGCVENPRDINESKTSHQPIHEYRRRRIVCSLSINIAQQSVPYEIEYRIIVYSLLSLAPSF